MEKKTIGGFISALRKANGMTQKSLADRLNVSDKTISRWECDDGFPDLSVIPVIAEIFGVTCDELLRGERKSPEERADAIAQNESSAKSEKQRQRLISLSLSKYKTRTYIAIGISILGLIAAAIFNIGFLRSSLGFLFGTIFYASSLICQAVFWNSALFSISEESVADPMINQWKRSAIRMTHYSLGVTVTLFGFTVPLLSGDPYSGLIYDWPSIGTLYAFLFLLVYIIICYFVNASHIKKGTYTLNEKEAAAYRRNHKLKKTCAIILLPLILVTLVGQLATNSGAFSVFPLLMIYAVICYILSKARML